ncbi:MAG: phage head closure protein [Pseudomonadota bacterium]
MTGAGALNKRITLQYTVKTPDGMGGWTVSYVDHATIWAAIWPTSAKELVAANATSMVVSHRIRIRYRSVLKAAWRIRFGNRYFAIVSVINPNEAGEWLDIMCKEAA